MQSRLGRLIPQRGQSGAAMALTRPVTQDSRPLCAVLLGLLLLLLLSWSPALTLVAGEWGLGDGVCPQDRRPAWYQE